MKKIRKFSRKDLSTILGGGIGGCHMNGDSAYCWTDCECTFGKACEMDDDGNPGRCVSVGGGNPGGGGTGGCIPPSNCEDLEPF
ncbi:hypothetical protein SAMN05421594_3797 [Chryseobacterium oleae]|uniref:Uncharacterized protein n=1 Tax=Chryseobacterium oleae TaxID=491207 RepID=A0A1I5B015_CHROL|nr:hypothetical protein [Chryseobacterium oleae]SFN67819.1 hypothetical protein SAMN05421594_3797 [Chryseobacterium oleae]